MKSRKIFVVVMIISLIFVVVKVVLPAIQEIIVEHEQKRAHPLFVFVFLLGFVLAAKPVANLIKCSVYTLFPGRK